jgi:prepilin-type N-terminal cleavage/methylation domain-containing protein
MFKQKGIMKQKGFTLLELLVVITLLAILAVGGLVAYDGVGENAEAAAASYNAGTLDRAVRQYRAVTNRYPDQWDNLANPAVAGVAVGSADAAASESDENDQFLPLQTRRLFGSYNLGASTLSTAVLNVVEDQWGMEEIQHNPSEFDPAAGVAPGKFHNEGTLAGAVETEWGDFGGTVAGTAINNISVLVTSNGAAQCTIGGTAITPFYPTGSADVPALTVAERSAVQNAMNDAMGANRCHFTIALGFGGDAASSTSRASVSIPAAPTYSSPGVNVANNYGRYIGLFHMGRTGSGGGDVTELFARPKLIGFVDTEGNPVDVNIARTRSDTAE